MNIAESFGVGKPTVKNYKVTNDFGLVYPELIIGLELETENCTWSSETYTKTLKAFNIDTATDGSLRGVAYEFITKPMRSDSAMNALTDYFAATGFTEANYTDRCSIHVHVNCTDMSSEQLSSIALLYTVVEEVLFQYVGRHRDSNIYCIPWNQCRQHLDLVNRFLTDPSRVLGKWNKYTALNLIPLARYGTVEFRQMYGTADMTVISKWVNIIGALFKMAKNIELKVLITELKGLNSNSQYEAFFDRLFSGTLKYNDTYRQKLEEGVILAKFSLINQEVKKGKPSTTVEQVVPMQIPPGLQVNVNRAVPMPRRPRAAAGNVAGGNGPTLQELLAGMPVVNNLLGQVPPWRGEPEWVVNAVEGGR